MNQKKQLALYGLKWNPFAQEVPPEALWIPPRVEHFVWRLKQQAYQGGFAMITGELGVGKSTVLRFVAGSLDELREVHVGVLTRPQSRVSNFYREMGELFGVTLSVTNRWGGYKALRERWKAHVESTLMRPVLLIDEAQELPTATLSELRLLQSANFDSTSYLAIVLCGDSRLATKLNQPQLLPVLSRIRTRLVLQHTARDELLELLDHALQQAGNRNLLKQEVVETLVDHCGGNVRTLMNMGNELLEAAMAEEAGEIDEKLYLEVFTDSPTRTKSPKRKGRRKQ
jgi:type II secretory pathway predicted ATPase ExeA